MFPDSLANHRNVNGLGRSVDQLVVWLVGWLAGNLATGGRGSPETTTGPGQLAMSGPVIRFALVVTSLPGKLAISLWPPFAVAVVVVLVSNRFPSWRFAVAGKLAFLAGRMREQASERVAPLVRAGKRCERSVARGETGRDGSRPYSDKLYHRFVMGH